MSMRFRMKSILILAAMSAVVGVHAAVVDAGHAGSVELRDLGVTMGPLLIDKDWSQYRASGSWMPAEDGTTDFKLKDRAGKVIVEGKANYVADSGKLKVRWDFTVKETFSGNGLVIGAWMPIAKFAGDELLLDGAKKTLPAERQENPFIANKSVKTMTVGGRKLVFEFSAPTAVHMQDNRKWNGSDYGVRFATGVNDLKSGERRTLEVTISAGDALELVKGPTVIGGDDWVPLEDSTAIKEGSVLDFSGMPWMDAPAGKHGRVVVRDGHFEFEKLPGVKQRFYGVNLVFGACYMSEAETEELADRIARMGYNTVRIHHHERELCDKKDGTTIIPWRMEQLDNLMSACIKRGIYLTTDLYVSRNVPWRSCGIDRDGIIPMQEFKERILFQEGVYSNYLAFARQFLNHVNPKTGRRWADEPALAHLALVNEGNLGNCGYDVIRELPEVKAAYKGVIPKNPWENTVDNQKFCIYLADVEIAFVKKMRRFIREEIKSEVLLTDLSCWKNPVQYQLPRQLFDYIDDHFYVDHPQFLEQSWRLPSKLPNVNPVRNLRSTGFQSVFKHRDLHKPFTLTEFNYSGPGQFRGVGGMMLGAQAALQDYDGAWRFAWSHDHDGALEPRSMNYFDVARDPLQRATERAVMTLFMRQDMKPLTRTYALAFPEAKLRDETIGLPQADMKSEWFGWYYRLGTAVTGLDPKWSVGDYPVYDSVKDSYYRDLVKGLTPGDGQVVLDPEQGIFGVVTPMTCGFFAERGGFAAGAVKAEIEGAPAAVWASSLDGKPVAESAHVLLTHVTDVQDTGTVYADHAKTILCKWGKLPHMMHKGTAKIRVRTAADKVYAVGADGSRRGEIAAERQGDELVFTADTARNPKSATYLYELVK